MDAKERGSEEVTRLLESLNAGEPGEDAASRLSALVYGELRRLAGARLAREAPGQTLQPTALVHEAWLRLAGQDGSGWEGQRWKDRRYFFAAAGEAMRRILIERARGRARLKRGGDRERIQLEEAEAVAEEPSLDLIALDEALRKLEAEDPIKAELVQLRYFTGLTIVQAAETLDISRATADRHWAYARAFLFTEISGQDRS